MSVVPDGLPRGRHDARVDALGAGRGAVQHLDLPLDEPLDRIEFVAGFADAEGNPMEPAALGLPPAIPAQVRHVVTLSAVDDAGTELTVHEFGYPDPQIVEVSRAGMEQCLDKMSTSFATG